MPSEIWEKYKALAEAWLPGKTKEDFVREMNGVAESWHKLPINEQSAIGNRINAEIGEILDARPEFALIRRWPCEACEATPQGMRRLFHLTEEGMALAEWALEKPSDKVVLLLDGPMSVLIPPWKVNELELAVLLMVAKSNIPGSDYTVRVVDLFKKYMMDENDDPEGMWRRYNRRSDRVAAAGIVQDTVLRCWEACGGSKFDKPPRLMFPVNKDGMAELMRLYSPESLAELMNDCIRHSSDDGHVIVAQDWDGKLEIDWEDWKLHCFMHAMAYALEGGDDGGK